MKKLKTAMASLTTALLLFPSKVYAAPWSSKCVSGPNNDVPTILGLECLLGNVISNALRLVGLVAFVFVIIGAFRWISSSGDPKGMEGAKKTVTTAIFGLILAVMAIFIMMLISSVTGVDLLNIDLSF
ncbi:hypothetical protein ACFL1M_02555 [Patescibacteria group bacterium]